MSHFLHREAEAPRTIKLLNWNSDSGLSDPNPLGVPLATGIVLGVSIQPHKSIRCEQGIT